MGSPLGIYISVPFCKAKCTFCNFASGAFGSERLQSYVDRLTAEIRDARSIAHGLDGELGRLVDTVYFGGGTPSLLSAAQVTQIFTALHGNFEIAKHAEITLECAPGQLSNETFAEMQRQGMSRVSLGVQSFVDREAAAVGRLHTHEICDTEIQRLRASGVSDINLDLIVGLPLQTKESWRYSVDRAIDSSVPHVSVYMLEIDEDSRLGKERLAHGNRYHASDVPDEDAITEWYELACDLLNTAGIRQYEISNFARERHQSRHNLKYWKRQPYIGFGLDAHSMLPTTAGAVRFANTDDLDRYLANETGPSPFTVLPQPGNTREAEAEFIGFHEAFEESLFLGLRLNEGVDLETLRRNFSTELVESIMPSVLEICDAGLLELEQDTIRLTRQGKMASNEVFGRLLIPACA
jgi:oxygen-independent coproporphyrinogen-3 oxidase